MQAIKQTTDVLGLGRDREQVSSDFCIDTQCSDNYTIRRQETQHEHLQTLLWAHGFEVVLLPVYLRLHYTERLC